MHMTLTQEVREILATTKTVCGSTFAEITGHCRVAVDNVEVNEVAQIIFHGYAKDPGAPADCEEVVPVWLHKYAFGWMLILDSGDQYAVLN